MSRKEEKIHIAKLINNIIESKIAIVLILIIVVIICVEFFVFPMYEKHFGSKTTVVNQATLTDVINTSQISTYQTTYNGIAEKSVKQNKKLEIKYLVNYKATVTAGIDMKKIKIDSIENNEIVIKLPSIEIDEPSVDIQTLDYIFYDNSYNKETITAEAYKLSNQDARKETKNNKAIKKLALDNLKRLIKALINPLLEEDGKDYTYKFIGD